MANKVIHRAIKVKKLPNKRKTTVGEKLLYLLAVLSGLGTLAVLFGAIAIIVVFTVFSSTLPSPTRLTHRNIAQSTKIYDRNDTLLYSVYDEKNRTLVKIDEVSPYVLQATLAAEDADFYKHEGIDPFGIARSIYKTALGKGKQGGSTITQQVAKNALLTSERTVKRKIKDMVLALQIEKAYSKDEILQMYVNEVPYGGATWGIEAASKTYFNKKAKDLTLAEAALLAGLPQAPTRYSPFNNPDVAKERQKHVLWLMRNRGWIDRDGQHKYLSEEEYQQALNEPLTYAKFRGTIRAPHFVMYVLAQLREKYGNDMVDNGGLIVKTSLDLPLQEEYQKYIADEVANADKKKYGFTNAGLVALDPKTGQILAMVGSKDYFADDIDGQFNVTTGLRQPGSTLKPITYLTGFTKGYTASTVLFDVPTEFKTGSAGQKPYKPKNYGGWGFRGPLQVRYALQNSVNVTAVKMLDLVGIQNMVNLANDLGVKSLKYDPSKIGLSITLGGGEVRLLDLVHGYASLAAKGQYRDLVPILEVKTSDGKVLDKQYNNDGRQVVDNKLVWILTNVLSDNQARAAAFGTRSQLYIPNNKVAVKTGTSNDLKDNWTVGFTPDIAIGVWVGNNDGKPMNSRVTSGLTGASTIWNKAMTSWVKEHPNKEFPRPDGIVDEWVGSLSGMVPYEDKEERRIEYFVKGTEPKAKSPWFKRVKVCKHGKIKDKLYIEYKAQKEEWQPYLESWIKNKYKDDEDQLYKYMGPDYEKEHNPDKFDLDDCEDDDD